MEETNTFNKVVTEAKRAITAKALISTASIGMLIPFAKLIYWVFDTSYLAGFGISPDIYSRPIFASGFVSTWLVVESLGFIFFAWSFLAIVFFIILTSANISPRRYEDKDQDHIKNTEKVLSDQSTLKEHLYDFLQRVSDAAGRSIEWPLIIWGAGFSFFLFFMLSMLWASNKGSELAISQRDLYLKHGFCADKFNSSNLGCFAIHKVEGENHFIIANSKTHLIYLSREGAQKSNENSVIELTIMEKKAGTQHSITRNFISIEKPLEDPKEQDNP